MKKQLQRILQNKPQWLNRRVLLLGVTLLVFVMAMAWGEPIPQGAAMFMGNQHDAQILVTSVDAPTFNNPENTDADLIANKNQTDGVILGSAVLIMIIIGGTISAFRFNQYSE